MVHEEADACDDFKSHFHWCVAECRGICLFSTAQMTSIFFSPSPYTTTTPQQTQLSYFLPITLQNKDVVKNSFRVCDLRRSDGGHLDLLVWVWPEDEVDR